MLLLLQFLFKKSKFDKHVKYCSGKRVAVYKVENVNLITNKDNFKFRCNLPFAVFFDFETTTASFSALNSDKSERYPVSLVIIFAFHSKWNLERIIIERSFSHSLEKLTTVSYLSSDILENIDSVTAEQLKDCTINVNQRKEKYVIGEMCSTELKFNSDCLMKWFNRKYKSRFLEIDVLSIKKRKKIWKWNWNCLRKWKIRNLRFSFGYCKYFWTRFWKKWYIMILKLENNISFWERYTTEMY